MTYTSGHYINVCPEGYLVSQCRCPKNDLRVVDCPPGHKHVPAMYRGGPDFKPALSAKLTSLAKKLHSRYCSLSHEDQCSWDYEETYWHAWDRGYQSVWDSPTHKRWLEEAKTFEAE